jgi:hypothetical protein
MGTYLRNMKLIAALGCLMPLVVCVALAADEPVNPDPGGIFDFSELDVPKEEEELQADAAFPEEVRKMLDRLTVYMMIQDEIIVRRTEPLRTTSLPPTAKVIEWADLMSGNWLVEDGSLAVVQNTHPRHGTDPHGQAR